MYSFLVLLPLTLITAALGGVLVFSPQLRDYVDFIATIEGNPDKVRLAVQVCAHIAAYAITLFVLVATTRTISAPVSRERPDVLCRLQMALEAIFVAVPSLIIVALATYAMARRVDLIASGQLLARRGPGAGRSSRGAVLHRCRLRRRGPGCRRAHPAARGRRVASGSPLSPSLPAFPPSSGWRSSPGRWPPARRACC